MLNRWIGIVCAALMLGANATLFLRDILPGWLAGDPPTVTALQKEQRERRTQIAIFDAENRLVGRSWTITESEGDFLTVTSKTLLHPIRLPHGVATPQLRVDTVLDYRLEDGLLSDLLMKIHGLPMAVVVRGGFMPPDEFACKWRIGRQTGGEFVLDAETTRALGDVLRPFGRLPGLHVGRTWRLQLLNPLARVVPDLREVGLLEEPELVRVTRTETITHRGRPVEVFVVEAHRLRAWVARDGTILRQEVEVPLLGKLTMRAEPFDEKAYERARLWRAAP